MAAVEPQSLAGPRDTAGLYDRHYGRVLSFCLWRLGRREDAEDAAQTTFLNAHRALGRGTRPSAEGQWLLAIAQNVCRARWRAERSRPAEVAHEPEKLASFAAPEHNGELSGRIRDALARLPEQQQRAFVLREWQGLSYAEIAGELAISEGAVASLVFRARQSLAATLAEERAPRRLHGLNLASLFGWAKSLLGGTAAKVAVAGALVGATVAVGVPIEQKHGRHAPAAPAKKAPLAPSDAKASAPEAAKAERSATGQSRRRGAPAPQTARSPEPAEAATGPANDQVTPPAAASPRTPASGAVAVSPPSGAPVTASPPTVPTTTDVVGAVTDAAQQAVSQLPTPPALPPVPPPALPPAPKLP